MKSYFLPLPIIALCLAAFYYLNVSQAVQHESSEVTSTTHQLSQPDRPNQPTRPFRDVDFLDKRHGWGVTDHMLWKTTDGGQTWAEIRISPKAKIFGSNAPQEVMEKVQFTNQENGWVVEGDYLIHTTDGGDSWEKREIKNVIIRSFRFIDSNNGWAVGELLRLPNQRQEVESWHPVVYSTTDGGRSWHNRYTGPEEQYPLWDVWPISASDIWAVGFAILHSQDGGKNWERVHLEDWGDTSGMPVEIGFVSPTVGWMETNESSDRYLFTEDGGKTWKPRRGTPEKDGLRPQK